MIQEYTIHSFLEELSSKSPTPGGGGASGLSGAAGAALGEMVIHLTIGKKKYAEVEEEMKSLLIRLEEMKKEFLRLADQDAVVFAPLAEAYSLPSGTEKEKAHKAEVLEIHLMEAALVPVQVMKQAVKALSVMEFLADKGSRLAVSDVGVGVQFIRTALLGARMNVAINTRLMKDRDKAAKLDMESEQLVKEGTRQADAIYGRIEETLTTK